MTRVLNVFSILDRGGAESRTMDIYRRIDKTKIQFDFLVHSAKEGAFEKEIKNMGGVIFVSKIRYRIYNFFSYFKYWEKFFADHPEYRIIHIHTTNYAFPIIRAAKRNKINVIISHARNSNVKGISRLLIAKLHRSYIRKNSTICLAVSAEAGDFVFGSGYKVLPNAINANEFRYNDLIRENYRKEFNLQDKKVICNVARFHPQKNHFFIIDVFEKVKERVDDSVLVLVGDGELRDSIEKYVKSKHLDKDVIFLGVREDVNHILQMADIFILPSLFEGLPGTALEAQAAGLPVLLSDKVTREASVVDGLVVYLPIDQGVMPWVNSIVTKSKDNNRQDTYQAICDKGYNIDSVVKMYETMYLEKG